MTTDAKTRTVHKQTLRIDDSEQKIPGTVLHIDNQAGDLVVWFEPHDERVDTVRVFGTGHPITGDAFYLGSAVIDPFVWHVFEVAS